MTGGCFFDKKWQEIMWISKSATEMLIQDEELDPIEQFGLG